MSSDKREALKFKYNKNDLICTTWILLLSNFLVPIVFSISPIIPYRLPFRNHHYPPFSLEYDMVNEIETSRKRRETSNVPRNRTIDDKFSTAREKLRKSHRFGLYTFVRPKIQSCDRIV